MQIKRQENMFLTYHNHKILWLLIVIVGEDMKHSWRDINWWIGFGGQFGGINIQKISPLFNNVST
jgi:hypothetical protein